MIFQFERDKDDVYTAEDSAIDSLTPEEVEHWKYERWSTTSALEGKSAGDRPNIVAEGDSWFDYMPGIDILDHLVNDGYGIAKLAKAGDSLENMVFGTAYNRNFSRKPNPLDQTIALLKKGARIFLFSGGGNDVAGSELEGYLNHKDSGTGTPLRTAYVDHVFGVVVKATYMHLARRVRAEVGHPVHIITHGYGWAIPDGRAVINLPWGWKFIGPWLRPALTKKNYVERQQQRALVKELVNRFNSTVGAIASDPEFRDWFHYIDLRTLIDDRWWVNELHLRSSAYRKVADKFKSVINSVVGTAA
mgnify:CR=1 FL=1